MALVRLTVIAVLFAHSAILAWGAWRNSPTWDEAGHLPAGIRHWTSGQFDLYRVNPPLVRMVATVPVVLAQPEISWPRISPDPRSRAEWRCGRMLMTENGSRAWWFFTLARWACIPFSLLGGYVCFLWARDLYGSAAGLLAVVLWCFEPNLLGHGQLITPDVGATAFGIAAAYGFWRWLKTPSWSSTLSAGILLGLAELTKTTWVILFPLWPMLWLVWMWATHRTWLWPGWRSQLGQMGTILLLAMWAINMGYLWEGTGTPLGDYRFFSKVLSDTDEGQHRKADGGNRFSGTPLGAVPVPLPRNYVQGIDLQKTLFEREDWSYLRGQWRRVGWWYYYLYAMAIKVPLGTWLLLVLAILFRLFGVVDRASWRDEIFLLTPVAIILILAGSQTGFNRHMRYVLPIFPFVMIWMSQAASVVTRRHWKAAIPVLFAVSWSLGSSLWVQPHSLSYFNGIVGGPRGGHAHLGASNIDWGQDLFFLKRWIEGHPEAEGLALAWDVPVVNPSWVGIEAGSVPREPDSPGVSVSQSGTKFGPQPGWYAVSVNQIRHYRSGLGYFLRFEPVDRVGYSMHIYHISPDQANRVRQTLGMKELEISISQPGGGGYE